MEERQPFDVSVTSANDRQHGSDREQPMKSDKISGITPHREGNTAGQKLNAIRTTGQNANNSDYTISSPITQYRISSTFDEQTPETVNFNEPTAYSRHSPHGRLEYPPELWRPFWIRKSTLLVLLLLFLLMILCVVLLWHYSRSHDGLDLNSSTTFYAWTYAPVAFMIVVVGLWRQVDFYFRLLAPWDQLRGGPVPASKSLLLDYVSPINIVSFCTAFKRGYTPVVLSISVFFALKITTLFAAALLLPMPTAITHNSTSVVSAKAFNATFLNLSTSSTNSLFTSDPVYAALGIVAHGIPEPAGIRSDYAYIPVNLDRSSDPELSNATYVAETEAFVPDLSCAVLSVRVSGNGTVQANRTTANSTNNHISLSLPNGNFCSNWTRPRVYAMNPQRQKTPLRQFESTMQKVYCADSGEEGGSPLEPAGLLFTVTDIRYEQMVLANGTIMNSTRTLAAMANVLCVPGYYILKAQITDRTAALGPSAIDLRTLSVRNNKLEGLSTRNLAVVYDGIMNASIGIFGTRQDNPQALEVPNTVFKMMQLISNRTGLEPFLNTATMQTAADNTFRRIISQFATRSLTQPSQINVTTSTSYTRDRLHVSQVTFYIVLLATSFCALCTVILIFVSPGPLVPRDPSLIATSATVLARSPELNRLLRKQMSGKATLAQVLGEHNYGTAIATTEMGQSSFKLVVSDSITNPGLRRSENSLKWWSPTAWLLPTVFTVVAASVALIVLLEIFQRRSNSNNGLASVADDSRTALYIHCIPVLVFLFVAAVVEFLNFHVALFSPWSKLASGNTDARRSVLSHLLGKLPPMALIEAVRGKHTGAIFSVLAAVIASILAVISAGLYTVDSRVLLGSPTNLLASDAFQLTNRYNVLEDQGAAGILRRIQNSELGYPRATYEDLVFPTYSHQLKQNISEELSNPRVGPFTAIIPALRADLKCNLIPSENTTVRYVQSSRTYKSDHYAVDVHYDLPEYCSYGGTNRNSSTAQFRNRFNVTSNGTTLFGGQLLDLLFGRNSSLVANYGETKAPTTGDNPPVGCPSLAFTFAEFRNGSHDFQVTPLVCYQQIQKLEVNVSYHLNSSELDLSRTPGIINSSVAILTNSNSSNRAASFDWRIQRNIERQLYGLDGVRLQSSVAGRTYHFDAFFSYLFNKTINTDPATLAGPSNHQNLTKAINTLYRQYMAQAINANMRVPVSASNDLVVQKRQQPTASIEIQGYQIRPRLIQHKISKLILQVFLVVTALFSILAYLLVSFHRLLPVNPCSIAGTMSLLAGSDLCWTPEDSLCDCCGKPRQSNWTHEESDTHSGPTGRPGPSQHLALRASPVHGANNPNLTREQVIPNGAEWMDHIKFARVFTKRKYSLGWWKEDRSKARRRRFGVDVGDRPDAEHDDDWELGDRRPKREQGIGGLMMKGRDLLGDRRGQYQRANVGTTPGSSGRPSLAMQQKSPPVPGLMSPRKVRFEDDV